MDIMFLLVPLSVVLALVVMGLLAWAVWTGQFDNLESEGERIFALSPEVDSTSGANETEKAQAKGVALGVGVDAPPAGASAGLEPADWPERS